MVERFGRPREEDKREKEEEYHHHRQRCGRRGR